LQENEAIKDEDQVVSWCDGDLAQVATIVSEESLTTYSKNKICANKQNAARSAAEQPADLTKCFKLFHHLQKAMTVVDIPAERHPMKKLMLRAFSDLHTDGKLILSLTKRNALVDFISISPEMSGKACTRQNILHGFEANGVIDKESKRFPDFDQILATCRKLPTDAEYELCHRSFPTLFEHQLKYGHVPDEVFEELGFPVDCDMDGKEVRRDATITQESRQRAKNLTHVHQAELRDEKREQVRAEVVRKEADKRNKSESQLKIAEECEEKIRELMAGDESTEISQATLEHFSKCKRDQLKAFVTVRKIDVPASLNKGKLEEANNGVDCLILRAFECRSLPPIVMTQEPPSSDENADDEIELVQATDPTIIRMRLAASTFESRDQPSSLLADTDFIESAKKCFDASDHMKDTLGERELQSSDVLTRLLCSRLWEHVKKKIKDPKKHSHWCLKWAASNLGRVAAIMKLNGHIKCDLECLGADATLLGSEINFCMATNDESTQQGAYLYYDTNDGNWIRSGKVTNRSFATRHSEHCIGAKLTTTQSQSSRFYSRYPSTEAVLATEACRKGRFENLQQFVACGFDCDMSDDVKKILTTDVASGGILHWDVHTNKIGCVNFRGATSLAAKQMHMVGYLFELAYDLCIDSVANVSLNPGFETCLGVW
jgi:hypothetical protein